MIEENGLENARKHLEGLFNALAENEGVVREEGGVEKFVEERRLLDFEGIANEAYLRSALGDKIDRLEIRKDGGFSLELKKIRTAEDLKPIRNLKNIRSLTLGTEVTDAVLTHLGGCTGLDTLVIAEAEVTDEGLAHIAGLINLENLHLYGCSDVTDEGLKYLSQLTRLKVLWLTGTGFSGSGLRFIPNPQGLRHIMFGSVKPADLSYLGRFAELTSLGLSGCGVTDEQAQQVADLAHLEELDLGLGELTNAGVRSLARLKQLRKLDLAGNAFLNNGCLRYLKQLTKLEWLGIGKSGLWKTSSLQAQNPKLEIDDKDNVLWL
jgi:hypothetical protein